MFKRTMPLLTLIMIMAALLAACGGTPATTSPTAPAAEPTAAAGEATVEPTAADAEPTEADAEPTAADAEPTEADTEPTAETPPTPTPVNISTFDESAAGGRTVVRWFVGLGTGTQPAQIPIEQEAVQQFNDSQDEIYLALEIIDNNQAYNVLATRIASGDVPDIIGPIGVRGRNGFEGQLLDLTELIQSNNVDLSQYPQELVDFYNVEGQGQIGLPYAIYPSFLFINKDLFDEAGLPYPPQEYGAQYEGEEWTIETMQELALQLTVDENGNDATSPDFDPTKIVQFGFHPQWNNGDRQIGTLFGAGSLVADDGTTAQIPEQWRAAWKWYHDAMFVSHFAPDDAYANSDAFGNGNVFNSGRVAMAWTHIWYTCCIDPPSEGQVENWDIAAVPSYNGTTTAKLHADTFSIMKGTQNPQEAFEVLQYLLSNPELSQAYGAMPAVTAQQDAYFEALNEKYAPNEINWQVAIDSLAYPDDPSHEADMPNFLKAQNTLQAFSTALRTDPDLDVDAATDELQQTLQSDFSEAAGGQP